MSGAGEEVPGEEAWGSAELPVGEISGTEELSTGEVSRAEVPGSDELAAGNAMLVGGSIGAVSGAPEWSVEDGGVGSVTSADGRRGAARPPSRRRCGTGVTAAANNRDDATPRRRPNHTD